MASLSLANDGYELELYIADEDNEFLKEHWREITRKIRKAGIEILSNTASATVSAEAVIQISGLSKEQFKEAVETAYIHNKLYCKKKKIDISQSLKNFYKKLLMSKHISDKHFFK